MNTDITLNEELFCELYCTLKAYTDVGYNPHPLGLCTFNVGFIDIVCADPLGLDSDVERDQFLVIFDMHKLVELFEEPFATLKEMQEVFALVSNSIKTIKNIIEDTKRGYLKTMKSRMDRWTPAHSQSLQELLELADADYLKFLTDTY